MHEPDALATTPPPAASIKEQAAERAAEPSSWAAACAIIVAAKEHVIGLLTQYLGMSDAAAGNAWGLFVAVCGVLGVLMAEGRRRERAAARVQPAARRDASAPPEAGGASPSASDYELAAAVVWAVRRKLEQQSPASGAQP